MSAGEWTSLEPANVKTGDFDFCRRKCWSAEAGGFWPLCACRLGAAERGFEAGAKVPTCENRADDSGCWKSASLRVELQAATGFTEQKADNWTDTSALFSAREICIPVTKWSQASCWAGFTPGGMGWYGVSTHNIRSIDDRSRQSF